MEAESFGGCGVVAAAFGDVQVAGVFDGRDDGGADGGQVNGPAAGTGSGGILAEGHVADVVVGLRAFDSLALPGIQTQLDTSVDARNLVRIEGVLSSATRRRDAVVPVRNPRVGAANTAQP